MGLKTGVAVSALSGARARAQQVAHSKAERLARWKGGTHIAVVGSLFWVSIVVCLVVVCLVVVFVFALAVQRKNLDSWGAPRQCCRL
jgi:CHASE3 domain sensor protein